MSEIPDQDPERLAGNLKSFRENNPLVALGVTLVFLYGIVQGIGNVGSYIWDMADSKIRPYEESYQALDQVSAGMPVSQFTDKLGLPILQSPPNGLGQIEYIYKGKGFYAQAITDEYGAVIFNSVTACANGFEYGGASTTASLASKYEDHMEPRYWFISGATSNSYGFLQTPSANPTGYRTSYIGFNDSCPWSNPEGDCQPTVSSIESNAAFIAKEQAAIDSWLACVSSNTIGWTSPADLSVPFYDDCDEINDEFSRRLTQPTVDEELDLSGCFTIGPNRLAIRTLPGLDQ